jgi:hypothetical protein
MKTPIGRIVSQFGLSLLLCLGSSSLLWETAVAGRLYDCTDSTGFGFFSPGNWIHNPVSVPHIVTNRSMSEPDTIKTGWNDAGLWGVWLSLVTISVVFSGLHSRTRSIDSSGCAEVLYERSGKT